jgi:hypothetical protein
VAYIHVLLAMVGDIMDKYNQGRQEDEGYICRYGLNVYEG